MPTWLAGVRVGSHLSAMIHSWCAGEEAEFTYRLGEKPGFHLG